MTNACLRLLVSDIDGTLVTPDKTLTAGVIDAVASLAAVGVDFTLISSRPPRGMESIVRTLGVKRPFAAFNGGSLIGPDLSVIAAHRLSRSVAVQALSILADRRVDAWVFADGEWLLQNPDNTRTPIERRAVGFDAVQFGDFLNVLDRVDKIVGVSDDADRLASTETAARSALGAGATVQRSQPYYLDITHPQANKGDGVRALARLAGVDLADVAVIGDMTNDMAMFEVAGFSVAMGQAPADVKAAASAVTDANTQDGVAAAIHQLVLPRAVGPLIA